MYFLECIIGMECFVGTGHKCFGWNELNMITVIFLLLLTSLSPLNIFSDMKRELKHFTAVSS